MNLLTIADIKDQLRTIVSSNETCDIPHMETLKNAFIQKFNITDDPERVEVVMYQQLEKLLTEFRGLLKEDLTNKRLNLATKNIQVLLDKNKDKKPANHRHNRWDDYDGYIPHFSVSV